jgi:exonuclease SbcD
MRLLLFADLHLDAVFRWAGPRLAADRRRSLRAALTRICGLADELRVDALLSAGDLFEHDRAGPDTAAFLAATFGALDCPVLLAPGNHDWFGPASLYAQARWPPNVRVFTEDRLRPVELTAGCTVWGAAHRAPANTDGFLDGFRVDRRGFALALFHGSERGEFRWQGPGKLPHAPFRAEQIPAAGLHHALVGHHHRPRDGDWHTYPGNPEPLTFGEEGPRAAVLLEIAEGGSLSRTRHPVAGTPVVDRPLDLTGLRHLGELRERAVAALDGAQGLVRLTVRGVVDPAVDAGPALAAELAALAAPDGLPAVLPEVQAVVPRIAALSAGYDLDAGRREATVRGQFVRDVLEAPLDEQTRQRVLSLGLRAFDDSAGPVAGDLPATPLPDPGGR